MRSCQPQPPTPSVRELDGPSWITYHKYVRVNWFVETVSKALYVWFLRYHFVTLKYEVSPGTLFLLLCYIRSSLVYLLNSCTMILFHMILRMMLCHLVLYYSYRIVKYTHFFFKFKGKWRTCPYKKHSNLMSVTLQDATWSYSCREGNQETLRYGCTDICTNMYHICTDSTWKNWFHFYSCYLCFFVFFCWVLNPPCPFMFPSPS